MHTPLTSLLVLGFGLVTASSAAAQFEGDVIYRVYGKEHANLSKARVVGDIDLDGADDYLVGSPDTPKIGSVGYCQLISGASGAFIREHYGTEVDDYFGAYFTGLHDIDGDGIPEYAISAVGDRFSSDRGAVFIYDGASGALLRELRDFSVHLSFGNGLLGGTDFTGDGVPDLAVVARKIEMIKIYDGTKLLTTLNPAIKIATGVSANAWPYNRPSERPLTALDDLNGDGKPEIALSSEERSIVFATNTGAELHSWFGGYVVNLDDLNGDGIDEFIFGHPGGGEFFGAGRGYVYDGATFTELYGIHGDALGYRNWSMCESMAVIDDITGDGLRDIVCGAPGVSISSVGSGLWLIRSSDGAILEEFRNDTLVQGYEPFDGGGFGTDLEAADIDGDGELEILIGAPNVHHNIANRVTDVRTGVIVAGEIN